MTDTTAPSVEGYPRFGLEALRNLSGARNQ